MVLELTCLNLRLRFLGSVRLPRWMGSAFRGGLGTHLRKVICYRPMQECTDCGLAGECLFYAAYENPHAKRGKGPPPRPIILVPPFFGKPIEFEKEAGLEVKLLLLGEYSRYLPQLLLSLQQFGSYGLGGERHIGLNKFEIAEAKCEFTREHVYKEGRIYLSRLKRKDITELPPIQEKKVRVSFRTPIQLPLGFPPSPEYLLKLIRQRLVMFVNEYGSGERVQEFKCRGEVNLIAKHYHCLPGYSRRAGKREFWYCWTGIADYTFEELDEVGKWLLGVGKVLGAGGKSSFGMGFLNLQSL